MKYCLVNNDISYPTPLSFGESKVPIYREAGGEVLKKTIYSLLRIETYEKNTNHRKWWT